MKKYLIFLVQTVAVIASIAQTPLPIIDMHFHAANFDDNGPPPNGIARINTGYPDYNPEEPWIATFAKLVGPSERRQSHYGTYLQ
ncbi:MAG: hypothetical protein ACK4E8_06965 [Lacibacter sp.]